MFDRREFIQRSSLLSLAPSVPMFLAQTARAAQAEKDQKVLVVIQLDGGNDGVNTVVPIKDEGYNKHRRRLRLAPSLLRSLDAETALHPSMEGFAKLWESERLAIVQGVGYPNPDRSHDVSMAIWQTCKMDPAEHNSHGWLGRALDKAERPHDGSPSAMLVGPQQPPLAIRGRRSVASAMNRIDEFTLAPRLKPRLKAPKPAASSLTADGQSADLTSFVRRTSLDAFTTAERLGKLASQPDSAVPYPRSELSERLKLTSRLIKSGFGTRVYYAVHSGYDTHAAQSVAHARLLGELSGAVHAFLEDLRQSKLDDRVAVLCFSEFGRRVAENASQGTDHGAAGPVFLAGSNVVAGLHAKAPSLMDLDKGDLKMSIDFRRVYASAIQDWLNVPAAPILGGEFAPAELFKA